MIYYCPYCGHRVSNPIHSGITSCGNCRRIFDSSLYHRLLSAGWLVRKVPHLTYEQLVQQHDLDDGEARLVLDFVVENGYSHEDLDKALIALGIKALRSVA